MQNILKEIIFWALLASCDFHNNEVQCPRKALLADAWSEILAGLSELGLTVITSLWVRPSSFVLFQLPHFLASCDRHWKQDLNIMWQGKDRNDPEMGTSSRGGSKVNFNQMGI